MPCVPCKKPNLTKDPLVDIEKILCDYAWDELADASWWDKRCKDKLYRLEVNWNYIDTSHKILRFKTRKEEKDKKKKDDDSNEENKAAKKKAKVMDELKSNVAQRDLVMFRTEFTNTSSVPQKFTFRTERSTKSSASIAVQRGWRVGANLNLNMAVPVPGAAAVSKDIDPCSITGGLSGSLDVTKTKGQTYEETLTWSVDSEVSVKENTRTTAALLVREEQFTADFTMESTIKCLREVIPVYLFTKKDDKMLQILEIPSDTFADIFEGMDNFEKDDDRSDNVIKCRTRGTFKAVYGAEQLIKVESHPLSSGLTGVGEGTSSKGALPGETGQTSDGPIIQEMTDED